jgi:hypothetical protein
MAREQREEMDSKREWNVACASSAESTTTSASWPVVPWTTLEMVLPAIILLFPVVFSPFSKLLWRSRGSHHAARVTRGAGVAPHIDERVVHRAERRPPAIASSLG